LSSGALKLSAVAMRTVGATGADGRTGASRSAADEEEEGDVASSSRPRFEPAPAPAAMGAALLSPSSISIWERLGDST